jgi:phosphoribosyl-dephospho-CoA transferase
MSNAPHANPKAILLDFTPMDLQFAPRQDADFTSCRDARRRICPVCELRARYCGHTRDEMIATLLPRRTHPVMT